MDKANRIFGAVHWQSISISGRCDRRVPIQRNPNPSSLARPAAALLSFNLAAPLVKALCEALSLSFSRSARVVSGVCELTLLIEVVNYN